MKKILLNIFAVVYAILVLAIKFGAIALHLYTILIIFGMHGFLWAVLAFCLPIVSQIYCFIASILISNSFLNTYSIWILVYLSIWAVLLLVSSILNNSD